MSEEEPVDEQYREQVCEDQYRDPEPEGQYLDQDFSEGFEMEVCVCGKEKGGFTENKWKLCLDEMDGISVWIARRCACTFVVEQEGWEIFILSQLSTKLMCHLA